MKKYGNWHGDSGISQYDDDFPDAIIIEYGGDPTKRYKFGEPKIEAIDIREMKQCARGGTGLAEFINTNKLRGERMPAIKG